MFIFIFFALTSFFIFQNTRSAILDASQQTLKATADSSIATIESHINHGLEDIDILSHNPLFKGEITEDTTIILSLYSDYDSTLEDITLLNLDGTVIESTSYSYRGEWITKPCFLDALGGNLGVSDAHILTNPFKVVVEYCAPIISDNTTQYVVSGQLNLADFWEIIDQLSVGESGFVMVSRDDGEIISHPNKELLFSGVDENFNEISPSNRSEGFLTLTDEDGVEYICYTKPLLGDVFYGNQGSWHVWALQEKSEVFAAVASFSQRTLVLSFTVFLFLFVGAVFFLKKKVIRPLNELNTAAIRIGKGDFSTPVQKISDDEIGRVALAFDKMRIELAKTISRLKVSIAKQHELEKVDKLKSNILNITSHELRTPLTAMKRHLQMLSSGMLGKINDDQMKSLDVVIRNSDRLNDLVQDILDTSRLESGTMKFVPEKVDLGSFISDIVETMKSKTAQSGLDLMVDVEDSLPDVTMDKLRISQVLINLIGNATKFSKQGSKIYLNVTKQNDKIIFEVRDEGRGIPVEKQDKVFDIFFQVDGDMDRKFGGAGLGLAITKGIVVSHGGNIWVESAGVGQGSSFKFTLPLDPVIDVEGNFKRYDIYNINEKIDVPLSYDEMIADLDRIFKEHGNDF